MTRLLNKDIETIFTIPFSTKVKIINEPIKLGIYNNYIYMEVHAFNDKEVIQIIRKLTTKTFINQ